MARPGTRSATTFRTSATATNDRAQYLRLVVEMAIDGLLADPRRLADAVDAGALIAMRQEFTPAHCQQVVEAADLMVVVLNGDL